MFSLESVKKHYKVPGFLVLLLLITVVLGRQVKGLATEYKKYQVSLNEYRWLEQRILKKDQSISGLVGEGINNKIEFLKNEKALKTLEWKQEEDTLFLSFHLSSVRELRAVSKKIVSVFQKEFETIDINFEKSSVKVILSMPLM